jgi:hypothetical protein
VTARAGTARILAAIAILAVVLCGRADAALVDCEGRCEDGTGNVMVVQNRCDDAAQRCVAGCDRSGERPEPYAECEGTGRAAVPPPAPLESPGGVRVRDGD